MKTNFLEKSEVYFPYVAALLFFFTNKLQISFVWYFIIAVLLGFYFFPVRLFTGNIFDNKILKNRLVFFLSCFILAGIISYSAILCFVNDNELMRNLMNVFSILNFLFLIYYFVIDKKIRLFFLHFGFVILSAVVLGL